MKTLRIYKRSILERTGFRKYPYKEVTQISIFYDGKEYANHYEEIDNKRLKIKFNKVLETRSAKAVNEYVSKLGRSDSDKFIKEELNKILNL